MTKSFIYGRGKKKASDEEILFFYKIHESVWKVGQELGMCGQSVHQRLKKLNAIISPPKYTNQDKQELIDTYEKGFLNGDGTFENLCKKLGREKSSVSLHARNLGLTTRKRKKCDKSCKEISARSKKWLENNAHPKGMLGKTHAPQIVKDMSERMKSIPKKEMQRRVIMSLKTKLLKYGTLSPIRAEPKTSWKQGWREIGGKKIYFRSRWEANYGKYLQWQKDHGEIKDWLHEPQTFWFEKIKRGSVTYLPDFKVIRNDDTHYWVEVKGWMDQRSKTKIRRFKKYFPKETLLVMDSKWFKMNSPKISTLISEWEPTGFEK